MPRRPRHSPGETIGALIDRFLERRRVVGYAETSVEKNAIQLAAFAAWCNERDLNTAAAVTPAAIEQYQRALFDRRRRDTGERLAIGEQRQRLGLIRSFFRWLVKERVIATDPTAEMVLPAKERRLPEVVTPTDVARILDAFDVKTEVGLRDRAICEVAWSSGLRRSELARLRLYDVDRERKTVTVREGKGRKDRLVPIGERALAWLARYLDEVRPGLVRGDDGGSVFLSKLTGKSLDPEVIGATVKRAMRAAGISKRGACHLLRHAMATAMLDGGADVRHIQQILGHSSLTTTQVYTAVSAAQLRRVHATTHPESKVSPAQIEDALAAASTDLLRTPRAYGPRRRRRR